MFGKWINIKEFDCYNKLNSAGSDEVIDKRIDEYGYRHKAGQFFRAGISFAQQSFPRRKESRKRWVHISWGYPGLWR